MLKKRNDIGESASTQFIDEYPGTYRLLPRFDALLKNEKCEKLPDEGQSILVDIQNFSNCYLIDLVLLGLQKEYINVEAEGTNLKVYVAVVSEQHGTSDAFEPDAESCLLRKILLPEDAEPIFAEAQYESGLLHLFVPKSAHPIRIFNCRIPVY